MYTRFYENISETIVLPFVMLENRYFTFVLTYLILLLVHLLKLLKITESVPDSWFTTKLHRIFVNGSSMSQNASASFLGVCHIFFSICGILVFTKGRSKLRFSFEVILQQCGTPR